MKPTSSPTAFACDNLTVDFGGVVALAGVSLSVELGERVALIGPSGGGKSTLLGVAAGLTSPTSGTAATFGVELDGLDDRERRKLGARLGIVAQDLALAPSLRVVHSVNGGRLGQWSTWRAVRSLVRPADFSDVQRSLAAVGLEDRIGARTGDLSGGEQQRVAVARVLHQAPDLVLADEPTSSVDPELADVVMSQLAPPGRGWTLLVSVHDPDLALRHVDRVVGLAAGKVAFDSPASDVEQADIDQLYARA